jgi:hypothetical protein
VLATVYTSCPCCLCCHQVCAFLDKLGELRSLQPLAPSMCRKMNELYDLDASQNYEVRRMGLVVQPQCAVLCCGVCCAAVCAQEFPCGPGGHNTTMFAQCTQASEQGGVTAPRRNYLVGQLSPDGSQSLLFFPDMMCCDALCCAVLCCGLCVCQIRCCWYKLCIAAKDEVIYPRVVDMLSSQGRMKVRGAGQCCWLGGW